MKKLIYIYIILGLAAVTGCRRFDVDEILLERDDLSLTVKGELMFSYDPLTCQTSQNVTENEYRLFDDDLGNWVVVRCEDKPTFEGQELNATISWTTIDDVRKENDLEFEVHKIDSKGKIWMWNNSKDIGVVIQEL